MTERKKTKSSDFAKAFLDIAIEKDFPENLDQVELGSTWFNVGDYKNYIVKGKDETSDWPICLARSDNPDGRKFWVMLSALRENYLYSLNKPKTDNDADKLTAPKILEQAISTMADRGKTYDTSGQGAERPMEKIVNMFNALTGHNLTTAQGWKFMCCLKLARSGQGQHKDDNYLDGAAYFALAGEAASEASSV